MANRINNKLFTICDCRYCCNYAYNNFCFIVFSFLLPNFVVSLPPRARYFGVAKAQIHQQIYEPDYKHIHCRMHRNLLLCLLQEHKFSLHEFAHGGCWLELFMCCFCKISSVNKRKFFHVTIYAWPTVIAVLRNVIRMLSVRTDSRTYLPVVSRY